ncbi:hypothetical protein MJM43_32110, partial [Salmonella enterica subsp. enterica serovar Montevideo]|nr:hypothetical protein [Salmonella enterica subsp. enterica serovar Montevideo]
PQAGQNLVLAGAILSIMLNPVLFTLLEKYLAKTETLEEQTLEPYRGFRRPTDSSPDLVVTEIIVMIGRQRPKEEHPELFLPLVT